MNMQVIKCPNCSGDVQIEEGREFGFCTYCGTKISFSKDAPVNATEAFIDNREAALAELTRINDHFAPIADEFYNIDDINNEIQRIEDKQYPIYKFFKIIFIVLFLLLLFLIFITYSSTEKLFMELVWTGVLMLAGLIGTIFIHMLVVRKGELKIEDLKREKRSISKIILKRYNEYPRCPIGVEYCGPDTIADLYDYIRKGRAETIKEAANLLEADEYNAEMKGLAYEMRDLTADIKDIANDTKKIADANLAVNTINTMHNINRRRR